MQRGEDKLEDSKQAAMQVKERLVLIRSRDPDLWGAWMWFCRRRWSCVAVVVVAGAGDGDEHACFWLIQDANVSDFAHGTLFFCWRM